jgi:AhpD family alkylhydroperoxidase
MSVLEDRHEADRDIEETLGVNLEMFRRVPDYLLPTEWASFKSLVLSDQTAIPNKYKEMIGLAVSGATRCRYCAYFHTEAARLFGATEDEINETALIAKNTMGWSTYLNTLQFDYDQFTDEFDQVTAYVREQMAAGAPA